MAFGLDFRVFELQTHSLHFDACLLFQDGAMGTSTAPRAPDTSTAVADHDGHLLYYIALVDWARSYAGMARCGDSDAVDAYCCSAKIEMAALAD